MFSKISKIIESRRFLQQSRNSTLMVVLGIVIGLLIIWVAFKAMQPIVRKVCVYVLDSQEAGANRQSRVVSVEGEVVKTGTMTKRISTVGKIIANASVVLKSESHAKIKEILFTEGASVTKDQPLIQFEDSDAKAELKQAEAQVLLTKADFERIEQLHKQKIGSTKDYDKARAEATMAEGRLDAAKSKLDKMLIKAPFEGTIGLLVDNLSVGAFVQASQELVTVVDATPIKIDFKVPEKHIHDIGVGQTVEVRIDAFKDQVFRGAVEAVDAKVEAESHSISLRGSIPNEDLLLRPGLFANISLIIGEQGDIIQIDEAAVDREGEIEFVWVVEKGKAVRRRVLTGIRENGKMEIVAGIRAGQIVVTAGQLKLSDGVRVKLSNLDPEPEGKDSPAEGAEPKPKEDLAAQTPAPAPVTTAAPSDKEPAQKDATPAQK
ncbi:efflux RND transporter periplasmic adaptor subunit [Candidatus Finniella inopinata]|uniref:Efflux RND transporter periplasmic adaptor subunit n=1 Tax=Candidatus Finniella inopinata TaxID=1696036 RepID=A0A4Q7DIJ6_9PROT|nr:efflux RND transporter periplasmic adaptor subunit [Candidatus Finniella inopinata]RZI46128.1 efflux RND transporter periplasmic adaptor subunit [Candidatus Finniella inopinata]